MDGKGGQKIRRGSGKEMATLERGYVREVGLMPLMVERKLFKIGEGGFAVTLPKAWINYHRLKPGDTVEVVVDGDLIIRVKVKPEEKLI